MDSINIASVLTIRNGSSRLPNKASAEIDGKPLALWIAKRLSVLPGKVIVATTDQPEDDSLESLFTEYGYSVYRGYVDDVISRMNDAVVKYFPDANFVFRALGDCPFIEPKFILRPAKIMQNYDKEAFLWMLPPDIWPVYGAREFPYHISAWKKIVENSKGADREHPDKYFHDHRDEFNIAYHEPPASVYFRPYRLEIDYDIDLEMVRQIARYIGITSDLSSVIRFLDNHPNIAALNREAVEKTGPLSTYEYRLRRNWMKDMVGKPVVRWDGDVWYPLDEKAKATPIFCASNKCLVGYGYKGVLYTIDGSQIEGTAWVNCKCEAGKIWRDAK